MSIIPALSGPSLRGQSAELLSQQPHRSAFDSVIPQHKESNWRWSSTPNMLLVYIMIGACGPTTKQHTLERVQHNEQRVYTASAPPITRALALASTD